MSNRTKIILIVVLTIILVGLLVRSMLMLKSVSPTKPSTKTEVAKAPTSQPSTQPSSPASTPAPQPSPLKPEGLSLALPPRNPFNPLVSEKKETAPTRPTPTQPPKLPAPVISQAPSGQASSPSANLILTGTVIGPKKVAIIKVGEKSVIVREGEQVDGLRLKKIERGKVIFKGLEKELTLKGGKTQ